MSSRSDRSIEELMEVMDGYYEISNENPKACEFLCRQCHQILIVDLESVAFIDSMFATRWLNEHLHKLMH